VLQVRGNAIASEREAHQIDEALVLRAALDAAAPGIGIAERVGAQHHDPAAVLSIEVAVALDGARTDVTLRMCFQYGAGDTFGLAPARLAQFGFLAHG